MSKTTVEIFIPAGVQTGEDGEAYSGYITIPAVANIDFDQIVASSSEITFRFSRMDDEGELVVGEDNGVIYKYERKEPE